MMHFTTKTRGFLALLMTLFFAKVSARTVEIPCPTYNGDRTRCKETKTKCRWVRKSQECLPFPTEGQCLRATGGVSCRKMGCVWNKEDGGGTCALPASREDPDEDFWKSLKGMDTEQAKGAIADKFENKYNVSICHPNEEDNDDDADCTNRNLDFNRVRLWTREQNNNRVKKSTIG